MYNFSMHTLLKFTRLISILSLVMIAVTTVQGNYQIGWVFRMYSASPNNYLATDGVCCRDNCAPCAPVLRFCFREGGHPHQDTETCTLGSFLRNTPSFHVQNSIDSPRIPGPFTGSFQVYIRVVHDDIAPVVYDPCHPIIDNVFFEFTGVATDQSNIEMQIGDFGRSTIELSVNVICSQGYNGTDCNTFCEEINGVLTCREGEAPTASSTVNPSSSAICMATDPTSTLSTSNQPTTDPTTSESVTDPSTSASSQATDATSEGTDGDNLTSSQSPIISTAGGLIDRESDNTLAIAVGVGVGGAVLLCLLVGLLILLLCLVCRRRRKKQKTAFYTVQTAEAPSQSANGDEQNGHPTNVEDLYSTVNKKFNSPPLPPAYVPDAHEYQNLNSQQGHQGVVYANASTSGEPDPEESIHLRYSEPTPSSPTAQVYETPHAEKSIYLRFADPTSTSHVNEDAMSDSSNE